MTGPPADMSDIPRPNQTLLLTARGDAERVRQPKAHGPSIHIFFRHLALLNSYV